MICNAEVPASEVLQFLKVEAISELMLSALLWGSAHHYRIVCHHFTLVSRTQGRGPVKILAEGHTHAPRVSCDVWYSAGHQQIYQTRLGLISDSTSVPRTILVKIQNQLWFGVNRFESAIDTCYVKWGSHKSLIRVSITKRTLRWTMLIDHRLCASCQQGSQHRRRPLHSRLH